MFTKTILTIVAVFSLAALACSVTINLPETRKFETGQTKAEDINIAYPSDTTGEPELTLKFGAGKLEVEPGDSDTLVSGTAEYNVVEFRPEVTTEGSQVTLSTGDKIEFRGIPSFTGGKYINNWDIKLGTAPMSLFINAGAYQGVIELGGLSLTSLRVTDGAADVKLSFSDLNAVEMDRLRYDTGASSVELEGLANANFEEMLFKGGAGNYVIDFSGDLQRDATVDIDAGISSVTIIVPEGTAARLFVDRGLANVDIGGDWEKSGDDYTMSGDGPMLTINVNIGAGNLELRNR